MPLDNQFVSKVTTSNSI